MKRLLQKVPLSAKLLLIALLPLIFLIVFGFQVIKEKRDHLMIVNGVIEDVDKSLAISKVANNLHLERRFTFRSYIDNKFAPRMETQRLRTDDVLRDLRPKLGASYDQYLKFTLLDNINIERKRIDSKQLNIDQMLNYYTDVILALHNSTSLSLENVPYLDSITRVMNGEHFISLISNYLGLARAKLYLCYLNKGASDEDIAVIQSNISMMLALASEYQQNTTPLAAASWNNIVDNGNGRFAMKVMKDINETSKIDFSIDPEQWWNISGSMIDGLNVLAEKYIVQTQQSASKLASGERRDLQREIIILIIIILVVVVLIGVTTNAISDSLIVIKNAAEKMAIGATGIKLPVYTNDAVGSLARSINNVDANNLLLSRTAEAIGTGKFDTPFHPRSAEDALGIAIVKMKEDLSRFDEENKEKIWLQSGLGLVNSVLRGDKNINELSKDCLKALCNHLGAQVGVFYVTNEGHLHLSGHLGISSPENLPMSINFGEMIPGEAVITNETVVLEEVKDSALKVRTGILDMTPKQVIIMPLQRYDSIEGVIELASIYAFGPSTMEFIKRATPIIAVAIHSAKSRQRQQELYEETQAQAEELQAQHTELENINSELEAQAQKLQASEEELRVQQEELIQANQELEERSRMLEEKNQMILEKNRDIERKAEQLEESARYKSEFLANMSHELRTPLNSILLLSRLLSENNEKNLSEEQVESAEVIQTSGKGLLYLIDEILDLSKIESGKLELEYETVETEQVARDMRQLFAPIANEKKVDFSVIINSDVPSSIETDLQRLEQILKNLVANALKFTQKGSVVLKVMRAEGSQWLEFSVRDTGIGIPYEKQELIFEAFQQADGSTRRKYGGTGLGLSISRELARLLGGTITLKSKEGEGSEFTLTIPTDRYSAEQQEPLPKHSPREEEKKELIPVSKFSVPSLSLQVDDDRDNLSAGEKAILIVEDDVTFAKALLNYTRKNGYKAVVALRGDEAIPLALHYVPSAILLDIQLPMKDGWQVMEELKAEPALRHIPVHMMSSSESRRESLNRGAVDFISKPASIEQMQSIFDRLKKAVKEEAQKVLIIEENTRHAKALAYFLDSYDISAEVKSSIADGIEALKEDDHSCIILDTGIHDGEGYKNLEKIKETPGLENVAIIIFTGKAVSNAEEGKLRQYADTIVVKTAHSYQRILDEVGLFLHLVQVNTESNKPKKPRTAGAMAEVLKDKKVLLADDDVRNIYSLTRSLEQHKMKVHSALNGKEALSLLNNHEDVDIILMDMMMPEMDGYETIKKIRKDNRFRNTPILAVTAKAMAGDREKCIEAGASDYISKPVDIDQLLSLLRVWLYDKV
jgi:signal transduction histidine kinase/DNA-binding response OmpR family regulator